jgi:hypothetical protein
MDWTTAAEKRLALLAAVVENRMRGRATSVIVRASG